MTTGILLTNLGTPETPTPKGVRQFLSEFLSDRDVVNLPPLLWQPLLHGIILPLRAPRVAKLYEKIWMPEGSPLKVISQRQARELQHYLKIHSSENYKVVLGMRYGQPSLRDAINLLKTYSVKKLIVLPLYPQYSMTTTGSTIKAIKNLMGNDFPDHHFIKSYADFPEYIDTLCQQIETHLQEVPPIEKLLFSFHSLPQKMVDAGDPYEKQCYQTATLLQQKLNLPEEKCQTVFQSRFGYAKWLSPSCTDILQQLPSQGITNIAVACPGFPTDCLETLEEIALRNREIFMAAGGKSYYYIPALNDSAAHLKTLAQLIVSV